MSRDDIRQKYADLMKEFVATKGDPSNRLGDDFRRLYQVCPHPFGRLNYEIGCWACPDCGKQEHAEIFHQHTK
jgi:hypothetical protein